MVQFHPILAVDVDQAGDGVKRGIPLAAHDVLPVTLSDDLDVMKTRGGPVKSKTIS